jgi:hypothetical protein
MEDTLSENDSRPLPQNATQIHLPVLSKGQSFQFYFLAAGETGGQQTTFFAAKNEI